MVFVMLFYVHVLKDLCNYVRMLVDEGHLLGEKINVFLFCPIKTKGGPTKY